MPSEVKILADSINPNGVRLTTFEVSVHLFNWVDWLTHREFSRNAQSNRAIPTKKIIESVKNDPALPFHWGKNQPGMQADEELSPEDIEKVKSKWLEMAAAACDNAEYLQSLGGHKQFVNRSLAPFMWIRAIISSTKWENFFRLRCHPAAQPEIRIPAERMREALSNSKPSQLKWGDWHRPLIRAEDVGLDLVLNKLATARVARVSYLTHSGVRDSDKDLELHDKLLSDNHMSPFEHIAVADEQKRSVSNFDPSWLQYRKIIENKDYSL